MQTGAAEQATEVLAEQKRHEEERGTLLTKVDQLQTALDKVQNELLAAKTEITRQGEDFPRQRETFLTIQRELRDKVERNNENILDRPDGYVTYVDYETAEVLVSINRRMRSQAADENDDLRRTFARHSHRKAEGNIELTSVGETSSHARIIKTDSPIDPIRVGDIVYSPAWSPNQPTRFALVGKMDVNRDSRDDREELKRMIQEAGGVVDLTCRRPTWANKPVRSTRESTGTSSTTGHPSATSSPSRPTRQSRRQPRPESDVRRHQGMPVERHPPDDDRKAARLSRLRHEHAHPGPDRGLRPERHEAARRAAAHAGCPDEGSLPSHQGRRRPDEMKKDDDAARRRTKRRMTTCRSRRRRPRPRPRRLPRRRPPRTSRVVRSRISAPCAHAGGIRSRRGAGSETRAEHARLGDLRSAQGAATRWVPETRPGIEDQ